MTAIHEKCRYHSGMEATIHAIKEDMDEVKAAVKDVRQDVKDIYWKLAILVGALLGVSDFILGRLI